MAGLLPFNISRKFRAGAFILFYKFSIFKLLFPNF